MSSILGSKPFVDKILSKLQPADITTLLTLVNNPGVPTTVYLYGNESVLNNSHKGVHYVQLMVDKLIKRYLYGFLIFIDNDNCGFFAFSGKQSPMVEIEINPVTFAHRDLYENLSAEEFRRTLVDLSIESGQVSGYVTEDELNAALANYVTTNTDQNITATKTFTTGIAFKHTNTGIYGIDVNEEGESLRFSVLTSPDDYYNPLEIAYDRVWTTVPLYANGEFNLYNSDIGDYGEYCGFYYTDNGHLCMYWAPYNEITEQYQRKDYYFPSDSGTLALKSDCTKLYKHQINLQGHPSDDDLIVYFVSTSSTRVIQDMTALKSKFENIAVGDENAWFAGGRAQWGLINIIGFDIDSESFIDGNGGTSIAFTIFNDFTEIVTEL